MDREDDILRDTTVFHVYCGSLSGHTPRVKAIRSIDVLQSVSLDLNEKLNTIVNRNLVCRVLYSGWNYGIVCITVVVSGSSFIASQTREWLLSCSTVSTPRARQFYATWLLVFSAVRSIVWGDSGRSSNDTMYWTCSIRQSSVDSADIKNSKTLQSLSVSFLFHPTMYDLNVVSRT